MGNIGDVGGGRKETGDVADRAIEKEEETGIRTIRGFRL